jgi:hypothetical protein
VNAGRDSWRRPLGPISYPALDADALFLAEAGLVLCNRKDLATLAHLQHARIPQSVTWRPGNRIQNNGDDGGAASCFVLVQGVPNSDKPSTLRAYAPIDSAPDKF